MIADGIPIVPAVIVGLGATLFMDLWAEFLKRSFGVSPPNYCLVGRWIRYMPAGTFVHRDISAMPPKPGECLTGWVAHYVIGVVYALAFVAIVSDAWLVRPTLLPAILFGLGSVVVPYLIMQPSFGLGIAASKAPLPTQARLRSLTAHAAFGLGLFFCAVLMTWALAFHT